jgi:hypothetical protein
MAGWQRPYSLSRGAPKRTRRGPRHHRVALPDGMSDALAEEGDLPTSIPKMLQPELVRHLRLQTEASRWCSAARDWIGDEGMTGYRRQETSALAHERDRQLGRLAYDFVADILIAGDMVPGAASSAAPRSGRTDSAYAIGQFRRRRRGPCIRRGPGRGSRPPNLAHLGGVAAARPGHSSPGWSGTSVTAIGVNDR